MSPTIAGSDRGPGMARRSPECSRTSTRIRPVHSLLLLLRAIGAGAGSCCVRTVEQLVDLVVKAHSEVRMEVRVDEH